MPLTDSYVAEVTVSVRLRSTTDGVVAEYSVTRKDKGSSISPSETLATMSGAARAIEAATVDAVATSKAMAAGVQNAERRRLK